ncbi:MAG TPA: Sec-independent protein translocase protein TatB [Stellaceae bacterium]|nr:Sec-independent protein translocase protein TatB [Stellaceae bacterium]
MFDFSWSELAVIAAVALVVIGPKDLPRVMRMAGFWMRKARRVAQEFQSSLDQMVRESELEEVRKQVEKASRFNIEAEIKRHIDPGGEIHGALQDPVLRDPMHTLPPPASEPIPPGTVERPAEPVRDAPPAPAPTTPASHDA